MHYTMLVFYLLTAFAKTTSSLNNGDSSMAGLSQEYCLIETFRPQCSKNEVILMESATYGRMRIGKCIKAKEIETLGDDPRYLGCSVDVLSFMDEQCSGRAECEIRIIDISDETRQPCFSDLKMYLEASYRCISVVDGRHSCAVTASKTPIHINGNDSVCGTESQPWTIEGPVGQKLNVSLLDLTPSDSQKQNRDQCRQHGVIIDRVGKRNITICGGKSQREKQIYESSGNKIEIFLNQQTHRDEVFKKFLFLLKLEAVGCSDVIPSEDTWLKRRDDTIVIGCYSSRQTWKLTCNEGKWTGVLGNCSQDIKSKAESVSDSFLEESVLSSKAQVLAIVSICGFTLAICFTIVCIGALCVRRYYTQNKAKINYRTLNYDSNFDRSKEFPEQRMSSSFPTNYSGEIINGTMSRQV